jgi:hypothetical protein
MAVTIAVAVAIIIIIAITAAITITITTADSAPDPAPDARRRRHHRCGQGKDPADGYGPPAPEIALRLASVQVSDALVGCVMAEQTACGADLGWCGASVICRFFRFVPADCGRFVPADCGTPSTYATSCANQDELVEFRS